MSEEIVGVIFALLWTTAVATAWFFAMFKGYDKVWSDGIIKYQSSFAMNKFYLCFVKAWNHPVMIKSILSIFLAIGIYILYISISDVIQTK
jgi:hypothetical protein